MVMKPVETALGAGEFMGGCSELEYAGHYTLQRVAVGRGALERRCSGAKIDAPGNTGATADHSDPADSTCEFAGCIINGRRLV